MRVPYRLFQVYAALCPVGGHQKLPAEEMAITPDLEFTGVISFNTTALERVGLIWTFRTK